MTARDDVIGRVRAANRAAGVSAPVTVPREYRRTGGRAPGHPELLELLRDRLVDYRATVVDAGPDTIPDAIATALEGRAPVLVPPGLPREWVPGGAVDDGFSPTALDGFAAVVTGCAAACAVTGTIALDASPDQGRRALTLVPDVHVCVVHAAQVVESVPELLARLDPVRPLTFVSGPSATSDIELQRVEGVHGPRTLLVVLVQAR